MTTARRRLALMMAAIELAQVIGACPVASVNAQLFPDPRATKVFDQRLNSLSYNNRASFVSGCSDRSAGDKAIFLLPLGSTKGDLELFTSGEIYNGADISIENGRPTIVEAGGGEYSSSKIQFYADELSKSPFRLISGKELRDLVAWEPDERCPILPKTLPPPVRSSHAR